jgi:flagellar biosynthesis component FlhA
MKLTQQLVPLTVLSVVVMMILPLPNWLLDILLCLNISFSIALLLSAATISQPERFTVLPSVILLSTLFRLGLNVSTTRQLLGTGEAPEVVSAFGLFVVGGSVVVGLVIFLIITLIQFIVISKGAERVAEVAARFTLDAMPGKQMSIDADLRSGSLSLPEAKERRRELQRESRLYGSLDGAMKFIKGDAIAGLVITTLNMSAGILIGVVLHGMKLGEAAAKYTLFTVGDGLVSQLPALLVSIAAGLVVTRVAENTDSSVGDELFSQIAREPRVPALTAMFLLALIMLPGLPTAALIGCACICLFIAVARKTISAGLSIKDSQFNPQGVSPISLRISEGALKNINGTEFVTRMNQIRREIFDSHGVIIPEPELELRTSDWLVEILFSGEVLASFDSCESQDLGSKLIEKFISLIKDRLIELVNDTQTRLILEANENRCPDLINSVIPSILSITQLTHLIKLLLAERVSVRDVPGILQGILDAELSGEDEKEKQKLILRSVRKNLKRSIKRAVEFENGSLKALCLSMDIQQLLLKIVGSKSPIRSDLAVKLRNQIQEISEAKKCSVLVVPEMLREPVASLLEGLDCIKFTLSEMEFESKEFIEISFHQDTGQQLKVAA